MQKVRPSVSTNGVGVGPNELEPGIFVGREKELMALRVAVEEALSGRGRVLLLGGEPGIGKTRTAQQLTAHAEQSRMRVFWGRCHEGSGAPEYWPWIQAMRGHVQAASAEDLLGSMGAGAADIARVLSAVRERLPDLPSPPQLEPEQERFRFFDGVSAFLKNVAARQSLLLVLDDLHWADPASLLLLQFLAREMENARLLVLCTYRDEAVRRGQPLSETFAELARVPATQRLLLVGLSESDVGRLIERIAGRKASAAVVTRIARQTEGNPFFVGEMVRWLAAEGGLEHATADTVGVPPTVRDVIGRRLDRLSTECSETLEVAAVIGRDFDLELLARVSELRRATLLTVLDEAVAARALTAKPIAGGYTFAHALFRETLYAELGLARRLYLHQRIGETIESMQAANLLPHLVGLAHHFAQAAPLGDISKAIDYARRAGARATSLLAYEDAVAHYSRALSLFESSQPGSQRERAELLLALGDAHYRAGSIPEAVEALAETADLARQLAVPELLARAALQAGSGWIYVEGLDELRHRLLEEASRALPPEDSDLRALVLAWLARSLYQRPDTSQRRAALSEEAVEMARRGGDAGTLFLALNCAYQALWSADTIERRRAIAAEEVALAAGLDAPVLAVLARLDRASNFLELGDIHAADAEIAVYGRLAAELRDPSHLRYVGSLGAMRALLDGQFHRVRDLVLQYRAAALESHDRDIEPNLGRLMIARDRETGDLERRVSTVAALVEQFPDSQEALKWLALVYAATGRIEEARRVLDRLAARDFADVPRDWLWLDTLSRLAEVAAVVDDTRRAELLYDLMCPYEGYCIIHADGLLCQGAVSRYLGLLAATTRRWEAAAQHFERAIEMHTRMGARPWLAHTQHDYAAMLLRRGARGDRARALALLTEAIAIAEPLGMKVLLGEAVALARQASGAEANDPAQDTVANRSAPPEAAAVLRHEGDFWTLTYDGASWRLKESKGMQYLAQLLAHPGQEFHALDLMRNQGLGVGDRDLAETDAGVPILDATAKATYRQRLLELREEIEEAEQGNDLGRVERLRAEVEAITEQLASAVGLGGRDRTALAATERARSTVTQRIRDAIKRIGEHAPALADHLATRVRTGTFCAYRPDSSHSISWQL